MFKTRLKVFSTVASLMVGLLLIGVFEARGQTQLCTQPYDTGWLQVTVNEVDQPNNDVDFNNAILGTFDQLAPLGLIVGDADWFYNEDAFSTADDLGMLTLPTLGANTTIVGTQPVGWWSQVGERSTVVQITNMAQKNTCPSECTDPSDCPADTAGNCFNSQQVLLTGANDFTAGAARLSLHIQIFGSDCNEILDFCDTMSAFDTHAYDLAAGALVTNDGVSFNTDSLIDKEGFITITPVVSCPGDNRAIDWNYLHGSVRISDTANQFPLEYGYNTYMRDTIFCEDCNLTLGDEAFSACIQDGDTCLFREQNPPNFIYQNFNTIGLTSRSDVVFINYGDAYDNVNLPFGYSPVAALVNLIPGERNDAEVFASCPVRQVCFARFALNPALDGSDTPIIPIVTPTPTPSITPTPTVTITPSPTPECTEDADCATFEICLDNVCVDRCRDNTGCPSGERCTDFDDTDTGVCVARGGFGSSGSCTTIAGAAPVQLGTAMANILIPLVPALAIGFRVLRRKKKGQK